MNQTVPSTPAWTPEVKLLKPGQAQRCQRRKPLTAGRGEGTPPPRTGRAPIPARDAEAFRPAPRNRGERGSATIWIVTAAFAMSVLVGLAVDLGGQVHAQQRAHDLAAQAARTGAEEVLAAPAIEGRYAQIDPVPAGRAARAYLAQAGVTGAVRVRGDRIGVRVTDTYRPKFLGLIGISRVQVHGNAEAVLVRTLGGEAR